MRLVFPLGILLVVLFVLVSTMRFVTAVYGASIDDAYIFFVYARNLATGHGWSFNPGEISFGTSSPLWTLLLTGAALVRLDLIQASRILGGVFYAASGALTVLIFDEVTGRRGWALLTGIVMAGLANLLFISLSGMEVTTHIFLMLAFVYIVARWGIQKPLWLGVTAGLFFLSRPDAVIAAPILLASWLVVAFCSRLNPASLLAQTWRQWMLFLGSGLVVVAPWVIFVFTSTGHLLPTTHYAKLLSMPGAPETLHLSFIERFYRAVLYARDGLQWILTQNGLFVSTFLVVVAFMWLAGRLITHFDERTGDDSTRNHLTAQWVMVGILVLLPLEYGWQTPWWYGGYLDRYILPVLPLALILSFLGGYRLLSMTGLYPESTVVQSSTPGRTASLTARKGIGYALLGSLACLVLARTVSYSQALTLEIPNYRILVDFNESYRRSVAEWIRDNTDADTRVGETQLGVGAIGYYVDRYIVDAGGLVDGGILAYWAQDGDPQSSEAETFHYFRDKGVNLVIGPDGLENNPVWPLTPIIQIGNEIGDLSWADSDFNNVVLYRPRP